MQEIKKYSNIFRREDFENPRARDFRTYPLDYAYS